MIQPVKGTIDFDKDQRIYELCLNGVYVWIHEGDLAFNDCLLVAHEGEKMGETQET